ncbi:MAG: Bifunctional (p)ppGpp synthase/hydrolase relA [Smithella sp. PtaU1.Bin162]|nr:MAG: Bifunctional (p)ppGpp synthase/hydrolase relA [Smithella sp. PtaU1.Bin162]
MHSDISLFLKAIKFSAEKHRRQRRKDQQASPYINHPIEVADILWTIGNVNDVIVIVAALLHDTIEDTDATPDELRIHFGEDVLALVLEVSDDKNLPKPERKRRQIEKAPFLSSRARLLKLADKICNIRDITYFPPQNWSWQRKFEYLEWAASVIAGLRGVNRELEIHFDEIMAAAQKKLAREKDSAGHGHR